MECESIFDGGFDFVFIFFMYLNLSLIVWNVILKLRVMINVLYTLFFVFFWLGCYL